jgi:galactokinase
VHVRAAFAARFGRAPEGVWAAPGRVNLIGDHTDYNAGFVLPLAIDRRVTLAAGRRAGGRLRLLSLQEGEAEVALADVRPGVPAGWAAYAAGAVWAVAGDGAGGLDVALTSDVPIGSGLASSAALECATALAVRDLQGGPDDPTALALAARRAENEIAGVPCGVMDQIASLVCREGRALLLDTRSLAAEHIPLALDGLTLLVVDTRTGRALAGGAYAERRRACEEAAQILGVSALRDASEADIEAAADRLGPVRHRRARHVVRENARVLAVADRLRAGRTAEIGDTLTASHASLRDDYEVSTPALDAAVEAALEAGALGARMTGAGFGGCAIALVPADAVERVEDAVRSAFARRGLDTPDVFAARPAAGARRVS